MCPIRVLAFVGVAGILAGTALVAEARELPRSRRARPLLRSRARIQRRASFVPPSPSFARAEGPARRWSTPPPLREQELRRMLGLSERLPQISSPVHRLLKRQLAERVRRADAQPAHRYYRAPREQNSVVRHLARYDSQLRMMADGIDDPGGVLRTAADRAEARALGAAHRELLRRSE